MRFTLFTLALLALAQSVAPGVRGAPAAVSDYPLPVRRGLVDDVTGLVTSLLGSITGILGVTTTPTSVLKAIQQVEQEVQSVLAGASVRLPRALPSSSGATIAAPAPSPSTTSAALPALSVSSLPSGLLNTLQASLSVPVPRMRRQAPTSNPASTPSAVPTGVVPQSSLQPLQSVGSASPQTPSVTTSGSVTTQSQATSNVPSASVGQV